MKIVYLRAIRIILINKFKKILMYLVITCDLTVFKAGNKPIVPTKSSGNSIFYYYI